jgi:outer membrane protein TolC
MKHRILFSLVAAVSAVSLAQEPLSVEKAVSIALESNQSLLGAGYDLEATNWGRRNAVTSFLPKVEISSSFTRIDPESYRQANAALDFIRASAGAFGIPQSALANIKPFAYRDAYVTNVTVVQPLYNGGAELAGLNAANAMQDRSEFSYLDAEQDVVARVRIAYLNVLKSQELASLAKESAERTRRWLEMTKRRESLGSRTRTDVLRVEVQLAADEGAIINAENSLAISRLQLNEAMGVDLARQFELEKIPVADSAVAMAPTQPSVIHLTSLQLESPFSGFDASFLAYHPSMKVMEANLRLADINIERSWVNFKPRLNLAFQYGWEKNSTFKPDGIRPWALSLSLSYPLFNSLGDYTNLEKARSEFKRTEQQVESFRRGLLLQATNAALSVKATEKRIEIAKAGLQQAQEVLNSVVRRYDLGAASNVDLLDAQTAYTSARTDYITAVYDNYMSGVQLARATGRISR